MNNPRFKLKKNGKEIKDFEFTPLEIILLSMANEEEKLEIIMNRAMECLKSGVLWCYE